VGHKTHPLGFRLGVSRNHKSLWFSKLNQYSNLLKEDYEIRTDLFKFLVAKDIQTASISEINISRNNNNTKIQIVVTTAFPGIIVGKSGVIFKELQEFFNKRLPNYENIIININKIEEPFQEAELVGAYIVSRLEKRIPFKKVMKKAIEQSLLTDKVQGIKVEISGRLNGSEIARSEWLREGRVPLQTLRANIDYSSKPASTIYGILGVKVWLFKG